MNFAIVSYPADRSGGGRNTLRFLRNNNGGISGFLLEAGAYKT